MAFSDTIETTFLSSCYITRLSTAPDSQGNFGTSVTTITSGLLGDIQPATLQATLYRQSGAGADYRITHMGFFDVPGTLPVEGDRCVDPSKTYAIRNVRNFKTHLELELEHLGE